MKDKRGFTLVEIIISLAVGSIVLMIAGSMMFSQFKFMFLTTDTDLDKRAVDSLIDVVRSDVEYSYDVRLIDVSKSENTEIVNNELTIENGWHHYYVENDMLYRDDVALLDSSYYNGKKFSLKANADFENEIRIDFTYQLTDGKDENVYSARDTIMFLNVSDFPDELRQKGLYKSASEGGPQLTKGGYWFYYKEVYDKKVPTIPTNPVSHGNGTVDDIINIINPYNYLGVYDESGNNRYQNGEVVWYKGYWWERLERDNNSAPGVTWGWKLLTAEYSSPFLNTPNNYYSSYEKNDIVIYDGNYYQAKQNITEHNSTWAIITDTYFWNKLGSINDPSVIETVKQNAYTQKNPNNYDNVVKKYWPSTCSFEDISKEGYDEYNPNIKYTNGAIVKKLSAEYNGQKYYDLWIKKGCFDNHIGPGTPESGWIKIAAYYDNESAYLKDDIVRDSSSGGNRIFKAKQDVFVVTKPQEDIYYPQLYWEEYHKN